MGKENGFLEWWTNKILTNNYDENNTYIFLKDSKKDTIEMIWKGKKNDELIIGNAGILFLNKIFKIKKLPSISDDFKRDGENKAQKTPDFYIDNTLAIEVTNISPTKFKNGQLVKCAEHINSNHKEFRRIFDKKIIKKISRGYFNKHGQLIENIILVINVDNNYFKKEEYYDIEVWKTIQDNLKTMGEKYESITILISTVKIKKGSIINQVKWFLTFGKKDNIILKGLEQNANCNI